MIKGLTLSDTEKIVFFLLLFLVGLFWGTDNFQYTAVTISSNELNILN